MILPVAVRVVKSPVLAVALPIAVPWIPRPTYNLPPMPAPPAT